MASRIFSNQLSFIWPVAGSKKLGQSLRLSMA